jgi:excisionase family DNA binding protein
LDGVIVSDRKQGPTGYLTIAEAARRLGVARGTVYAMIQKKQLTKQTIGLRDYVPAAQIDVLFLGQVATAAAVGTVSAYLETLKRTDPAAFYDLSQRVIEMRRER